MKQTRIAPLTARQRLMAALIQRGRRALRGTPWQGSRLTRAVSSRLYRSAFPPSHDIPAVTYRGLRLTAARGDRCVLPALQAGGHESLEMELYELLARRSRCIVDAGASIGLYACAGAVQLPPGGRVIAFEPVPDNVAALERNLALNSCSDAVRIMNMAVGDAEGSLTLHLSTVNSGGHSAAAALNGPSAATVTVAQTRIDACLAAAPGLGAPDILKVDVEGYDLFALRGAEQTIERARPALFIEFLPEQLAHCGADPGELARFLFDHYEQVFAIDEVCGELRAVSGADLASCLTDDEHRSNLLAVSRPDHLEAVRPYATARTTCPQAARRHAGAGSGAAPRHGQ